MPKHWGPASPRVPVVSVNSREWGWWGRWGPEGEPLPGPQLGLLVLSPHVSAGEHPRMGALDVCPFIPVRGVGMAECVLCAQAFGQQLAEELSVPGEWPLRRGTLTPGAPPASLSSLSVPISISHPSLLGTP